LLHEFITLHREAIIARTREKLTDRPWLAVSAAEIENGVPLFLTQLCDVLRLDEGDGSYSPTAITEAAVLHGGELAALGFNVAQVVHDYGDICQAITEVALAAKIPITTEEFHTLNRCLDQAIAGAVTEHARMAAATRTQEEIDRLAPLAHEVRDVLNTALLAFHTLKRGIVAVNGSTGSVLGRSLMDLRDLVNSTLAGVRMDGNLQERQRITVAGLFSDLAVGSSLHAEYRHVRFAIETVDPELVIEVDPHLIGSALMNLLNNAFKYTPSGGRVFLRARAEEGRALIEVEDECGGIPDSLHDQFQAFGDRRGKDRSGLGLGLSMARKTIKAHAGEISVVNRPGTGCRFVVSLPLAAAAGAVTLPEAPVDAV
jgi:signal transduction histidine kinase